MLPTDYNKLSSVNCVIILLPSGEGKGYTVLDCETESDGVPALGSLKTEHNMINVMPHGGLEGGRCDIGKGPFPCLILIRGSETDSGRVNPNSRSTAAWKMNDCLKDTI